MNRCEATVIAASATEATVEVAERAAACGNCRRADGCHTGLLGLGGGPRRYRLPNRIGARPGDRVTLDVADGTVLRASLVSYLLPAVLTIVGAAAGQWWGGDAPALVGALIGLICGVLLLRQSEMRVRRGNGLLSLHARITDVHLFKENP